MTACTRRSFFLVLRGFVLGLCSLAEIDFLMDATNASFSFVLDTIRAMYLPSVVFALPVGYAALIFGGKYLSQVFLIRAPPLCAPLPPCAPGPVTTRIRATG